MIGVGGTTVGSQLGQIAATGSANLAGALTVNLIDGFTLEPGNTQQFQILSYASQNGTFGAANMPTSNSATLGTWYRSTSLTLVAIPIGTTIFWVGGSGAWGTASDWNTNVLPVASDVAYIGVPGVTVTSAGTVLLNLLRSDEPLVISGGTFTVAAPSEANAGLTLSGGTLVGNGTLHCLRKQYLGPLARSVLAGTSFTLTNPSAFTFSAANSPSVQSATFDNQGTFIQTGGQLALASATFLNEAKATYDLRGALSNPALTSSSGGAFINSGLFADSITGIHGIAGVITNDGTLTIAAGTLEFPAGNTFTGTFTIAIGATLALGAGTVNLNSGAAFTGGGSTSFTSGILDVNGNVTAANFDFAGGAMNVAAGDTFTWAGSNSIWSGGTLQGGDVANSGTLTISGSGALDTSLSNTGTIEQTAGTITIGSDDAITNQISGFYDIQNIGAAVDGSGSLLNLGTLQKLTGGTTTLNTNFSNPGSVIVNSGVLLAPTDTADVTGSQLGAGTWDINNNATLTLDGGSAITTLGSLTQVTLNGADPSFTNLTNLATNQGSLTINGSMNFAATGALTDSSTLTITRGSTLSTGLGQTFTMTSGFTSLDGQLDVSGGALLQGGTLGGNGKIIGNVTNTGGDVSPGHSPGIIDINGNYTQGAAGTMDIQIAGTNPATPDFDQLFVTGNVTLGGTLNVTLLNGFQPTPGQTFEVLNDEGSNPISGAFAGLPEGAFFTVGSSAFQITYLGGTGNDVVLKAFNSVYVVTNTSDGGAGSLRQAIVDADNNAGNDLIVFNIPTSDPGYQHSTNTFTIAPLSTLPAITDTLTIDGRSQSGFAGTPLVELTGTTAPPGSNGLVLDGNGITIQGLTIDSFASGDGIQIQAGSGDVITGNRIGSDVTGTSALANSIGIAIASSGNTIGGTTAADQNLISGNGTGISITGNTATGNVVEGNYIGTTAPGTAALGNTAGITISGAGNNTIGGALANESNVISGNDTGVLLTGSNTSDNLVDGNLFGTDVTGMSPLGNFYDVQIVAGAHDNIIGGASSGAGNLLAASGIAGVLISDSGTTGNVVSGNTIGGSAPLANASGVLIQGGASGNTIGGDGSGAGNLITFNTNATVQIDGSGTTGNALLGNNVHDNGSGFLLTGGATSFDPGNPPTPVVTSLIASPTTTIIAGSLTNTPNTTYDLDFFANPATAVSPYQGRTFFGSVTVATDSTGLALFNATLPTGSATNDVFTATVTVLGNNTSLFAKVQPVLIQADTPPTATIGGPSAGTIGLPVVFTSGVTDSQTNRTFTYSWSVSSSAGSFTLPASVDTNQPFLVFTPPTTGNYMVSLTVVDNLGDSVSTSAALIVGAPGPVITFTQAPYQAAVGSSVAVASTVLEPTTATPSTYNWNVALNGQPFALPAGTVTNTPDFVFTPTKPGLYSVTLSVTDSAGGAGSNTFTLIVGGPTASIFGNPATVGVGTPVTLTNAPGAINLSGQLTYTWTLAAPGGGTTQVSDHTGFFTFTPALAGAYQVSLVVNDNQGNTATANPVTVTAIPAPVPVTITGADGDSAPGSTIFLGNQTTSLAGVGIATYHWSVTQNGLSYTLPTGTITNAANFQFTPATGGLYAVTLAVTDSDGETGSDTVTILVNSISGAAAFGAPSNVPVGTSVTLTTAPSGPTLAGPLTYTWAITGPTGNAQYTTNQTGSVSFTAALTGNYQITLTVVDSLGNSATSNPVTVEAKPAPIPVTITNSTPSATLGSSISLGSQVGDLNGSAIISYAWSVTLNGSSYQLPTGTNTTASTFVFTPTTPGIYGVTLGVIDTAGGSDSNTVFVNVAAPVTSLTLNQNVPFVEGAPSQFVVQGGNLGVSYTYNWTVTGQTVSYAASGSTSTISFVPPLAGLYKVTVVVTGSDNSTTSINQFFAVASVPLNPTIVIGPSQSVVENTLVNLTAHTNALTPADVLGYQWTVRGPDGYLTTGMGSNFSLTPDIVGSYSVALTVLDRSGNSYQTSTTFQVKPVTPNPSIEGATGSSSISQSLAVSLQVVVPDAGPFDTLTYVWSVLDSSLNNLIALGNSASMTFPGRTTESYVVSVTVTSDGDTADAVTLLVPVYVAQNSTLILNSGNVPSGANQVLAFALGNATINGSALAIPQVQVALGSHDTLIGGGGANILQGDSGSNLLLGGTGPNTLYATANDTLIGGNGINSNLFQIMPGLGEVVQSGALNNTLSFAQSPTGVTVDLTQDSGNFQTITQGASLALTGSIQGLVGSAGADLLFAGSGSIIYGGGGNDTLVASGISNAELVAGNDPSVPITQFGGNGNDSLISSGGTSITLVGGTGNSTLVASGGTSITLYGGSGNDSLSASGGTSVSLQGGTGNSTLFASGGTSITLYGGSGSDSLSASGGASVSLVGGTGNTTLSASGGTSITLYGGSGSDSLAASGGTSVTLVGGTGNSTLLASGGTSITLYGGSGSDSLAASGGTSVTVVGGTGNSTLLASGGTSITLYGGSGSDSLAASGGTSVSMQGGSGNSTLTASGGTSITLYGGSGSDSLAASGGTSVSLQGGTGNSTLISSGGTSITLYGGSGSDSLAASGGTSVSLIGGTGNSTLTASGGTSITLYGGSGSDSLAASGGTSVSMIGGTGNSTLSASGGTSITLYGGSGSDSLAASGGTSVSLQGGTGNSTLTATSGTSITPLRGQRQ